MMQPPSKKQIKEREGLLAAGKPLGPHAAKEIRSVGLLKFIRNVDAHAGQMVKAGRFESEDHLRRYLLEPFPWLLMAVYQVDQRHDFTGVLGNSGHGTSHPEESSQQAPPTETGNPLHSTEPTGSPPHVVGDITAF